MKYFNRIIIIINTFLFFLVGGFMIAISVTSGANQWTLKLSDSVINYLYGSMTARAIVFTTGFFLVFIALFTAIGNIEKRLRERTVVLQSPLGDIMVSLGAIEDFSRVVKNQVNGVKDIKGKVYSLRKGLKVYAHVTLYSDRSVADVTQEVQEAIIKYIQFTLGIANEIKPTVIVSKIVFRSKEEEK